jgi:hypothetical protein
LTVDSVTSPLSRCASISPLTVLPMRATPAGDAHREADTDVVVLYVHASGIPREAFVRSLAVATRVHGADGDAAGVRDDLDADGIGTVAVRALDRDDLDLVAARGLGAHVAVDPLDFDRLPLRDGAVPLEVLRRGRKSRDEAEGKRHKDACIHARLDGVTAAEGCC